MPKSKHRKKKIDTKAIGEKKMMQSRVDLFNKIYLIYMEKSYPVLHRFGKMINSGNIKLKAPFIRIKALEMALQNKMIEAVENARVNVENKLEMANTETQIEKIKTDE